MSPTEPSHAEAAPPRWLRTVRWIFLFDDRLRAGWRLLGHLALLIGLTLLTILLAIGLVFVAPIDVNATGGARLALQAGFMLVPLLGATLLSAWLLDRGFRGQARRVGALSGVGLGGPPLRVVSELVGGLLLGALALVPALAIMAFGGVYVDLAPLEPARWLGWTAILAAAATNEELLFRGYACLWIGAGFTRLVAWGADRASLTLPIPFTTIGFGIVVVGSTLLFGVLHLSNPSASALSSLNTTLAGLWLLVLVLRTRTLTWAIGAHLGWNHAQGLLLGLPLSGLDVHTLGRSLPSVLQVSFDGPSWLAGGGYGPEGSIGATVAMVLAIFVAAILPRRPDGCAALPLLPTPQPKAQPERSEELTGDGAPSASGAAPPDAAPSDAAGSSSAGR